MEKTDTKFDHDHFLNIFKQSTNEWIKIQKGEKKSTCLFKDCVKSALKSHFFSLSTLKLIGNNSHIMRPIFDFHKNSHTSGYPIVKFSKVGIKTMHCSFRGFCNEHEKLFFPLDQNSELITYKDLIVQAYRSLNEHEFMNNHASILLKKNFNNHQCSYENNIKSGFSSNPKSWIELIETLIDMKELEHPIGDLHENILIARPFNKDQKNPPSLCLIYKKTAYQYKLALHNFIKLTDGFEGFIIVVPSTQGTSILIITSENYLDNWLTYLSTELNILCLIENLIIFDGKWFISPNIVEQWGIDKKSFLEQDYFFYTEFKFMAYDVSIFDEIRKQIISQENLSPERKEIELKKLNLPIREDYDIRMNNLIKKICGQHVFV